MSAKYLKKLLERCFSFLSLSETSPFDFGTLPVGGVVDRTFFITNSGAGDAFDISGGGLSLPFKFKDGIYPGTGGTCSVTLSAGGSCAFILQFEPTSTGLQVDTIEIKYFD